MSVWLPDCPRRGRQRAHEVGNVVWDVDGEGGDLRLHRLDGRLGGFTLFPLHTRQRREVDLNVSAGETEGAPVGKMEEEEETKQR